MAEIKSAYERAIERFKDVEPDRNSLKKKQTTDRAKLECAKALRREESNLSAKLKECSEEERDFFIEGVGETLLAQITLPNSEADISRVDVVKEIIGEIFPERTDAQELLDQYQQLCEQYFQNKSELTEQLKAQYMQIMQQQGQANPNMEASFIQTMQEQIKGLEEQYSPTVEQVKENLQQILGLAGE